MIKIDDSARVSALADIEDSVRGSLIEIGPETSIDSFVKIKPAGGTGDVRIGARVAINSCVVIYSGNGVAIGDNVAIAANTTIAPTNHEYRERDKPIAAQRFMASKGGVIIEEDVWIGANCVLLDGTILRKGAVLGAGSLANREYPPYSINIGSPAKTVRYRGAGETVDFPQSSDAVLRRR